MNVRTGGSGLARPRAGWRLAAHLCRRAAAGATGTVAVPPSGGAVLAVLGALLLAGCGGSATGGSAVAGSFSSHALTIEADSGGAPSYVQGHARAAAGTVRITLVNHSGIPHDLHVTGHGVDARTSTIAQGEATLTATLTPGTYTYFCDVPGHRQAGMEGTLSVQ
ncbi:MAG: cupredoxin domain-containing protein [Acidobacteriota bacterium]|nr:cupredoxin domain-containing protein [Acidobacteriota bacterium]